MNKDVKRLIKLLKKSTECTVADKKHWEVKCPSGKVVYISKTPSCSHAVKNAKADHKRNGVALRG